MSRRQRRSDCVVVFAKPPEPGRVKTRLIGELTAQETSELYEAFLGDLLEELEQGKFTLKVAWALAEEEVVVPPSSVDSIVQRGEDLGARLYRALAEVAPDHRWVVAVGSDHPELTISLVEQAFDKLASGADLVLGPSDDGGYYLIAMNRESLNRMIFDGVPWSSDRVLSATLKNATSLDLGVELLPEIGDVDTPADLNRLVGRLKRQPNLAGERTRGVLSSLGLLADTDFRGESHESS